MYSSSFTDLRNASSVGSLNHATLSNRVRRSVVCIPNMSTFRAFRSFVCLSVFACTPVHSNSLTTSTDSPVRIAGALTKQLSVLPLSKHVSHTCLTSSSSTRVFHNQDHCHHLRCKCTETFAASSSNERAVFYALASRHKRLSTFEESLNRDTCPRTPRETHEARNMLRISPRRSHPLKKVQGPTCPLTAVLFGRPKQPNHSEAWKTKAKHTQNQNNKTKRLHSQATLMREQSQKAHQN